MMSFAVRIVLKVPFSPRLINLSASSQHSGTADNCHRYRLIHEIIIESATASHRLYSGPAPITLTVQCDGSLSGCISLSGSSSSFSLSDLTKSSCSMLRWADYRHLHHHSLRFHHQKKTFFLATEGTASIFDSKIFAHFVPRCMNSCNRRRLTSLQRYIFSAVFSLHTVRPLVWAHSMLVVISVLVCYFCCSVTPVCTMAYLVCIQVCFSSLVPPCPSKSTEKYLVVRGDQRESQRAEGQAED